MGLSNGCVACSQLKGVIGGVHVLPFYPSSADRGFAPLTYMEVDPDFGTWDDIHKLGQGRDLCMDFMVNHISAQSEWFKDFKEKGDKARSMFSCTPKLDCATSDCVLCWRLQIHAELLYSTCLVGG
jgi:glycosidase